MTLFHYGIFPFSCSNDVKSLLYYDPSIRFELFLHHASRYQTILSKPDSNYSFSLSFAFLTLHLFHKKYQKIKILNLICSINRLHGRWRPNLLVKSLRQSHQHNDVTNITVTQYTLSQRFGYEDVGDFISVTISGC